MLYKKFQADYIFTGIETLGAGNVLITDEKGVIETIVPEQDAGDDIEIFKGLISPGFINCHCHLELSHMKRVIESGTGLVDFLIKVVSSRQIVGEDIRAAMKAADEEMFRNGIVAVGDICNTPGSIQTKLAGNIEYQNFIEVLGFNEERAGIALQAYLNVYKDFYEAGLGEQTSLVPHAPYTISKKMFALINEQSTGKIISIHNQECLAEDELYKTKTGDFFRLYHHLNINTGSFQPYNKSSLQSYLPMLDKAKTLLLVHNTFTTPDDIDFALMQSSIAQQQLYWCLCPNANAYIENRLPAVETFVQKNCNIVLGTDSYSSNWSLDILDEIKTLLKHFPAITTEELLGWATLNGAKALDKQKSLGSFEKGKKPGVVLIDAMENAAITMHSKARRIV